MTHDPIDHWTHDPLVVIRQTSTCSHQRPHWTHKRESLRKRDKREREWESGERELKTLKMITSCYSVLSKMRAYCSKMSNFLTYSTHLDSTESGVYVLRFKFFFLRVNSNITWFYYSWDKKKTIHILFTGHTILFTHLKIILL